MPMPWSRLAAVAWLPVVLLFRAAEAAEDPRPNHPAPEECRAQVAQAEALGRAAFLQDEVSAWGTDALRREKVSEAGLRGWVTTAQGAGWVVHFYGGEAEGWAERFRVRFAKPSPEAAEVQALDPPVPVTGDLAAMIRARQAVVALPLEPRCGAAYNTVILPAALVGEKGWLAYLLAATLEPGVLVAGGHHRFLVSADGSKVLRSEPLSKACLDVREVKGGGPGEPLAVVVTHLISPCPIETHVLLSLRYSRPLAVATRTGAWAVEKGRIRYLYPLERGK